jgi:uncharacterized pyridoxamine 5'-phosphate oxidase family protein
MNGRFVCSVKKHYYKIFCENGKVSVGEYDYDGEFLRLHDMSETTVQQTVDYILSTFIKYRFEPDQ